MWVSKGALASVIILASSGGLWAEEPLSAIDWLSRSVAEPSMPLALPVPQPRQHPVGRGIRIEPITVMPLGAPTRDALGLLPASSTGLPRDLWGTTSTTELARLLRAERVDTLPAIQSLLYVLLLAELDPPSDADGKGQLFLARVDKLLDLGALEPAMALLEQPDAPEVESFRRWFDVALLMGEEDRACETMRETPEVAPTFPARIFCLARGGDWNAAALSLRTGEALGRIDPDMAELLTRFLDPELSEGEDDLLAPTRPSPLVLRLMEAIGQPIPTTTLPVAFAQADLRSNTGWKTRIEAAERLARMGAIEPNMLLGLYTEQRQAASGGVWERVGAIQKLDRALAGRDVTAVAIALPQAWRMMTEAELETPFAALYGPALSDLQMPGEAGRLAFRVGLLSDQYEAVANTRTPEDELEAFLIGVARGDVTEISPPNQLASAIKRAFVADVQPARRYQPLLRENRLGEALLLAIEAVTEGAKGELRDVTEGLTLLRSVGLESTARRAALELLLLERRG